jgi:DNA primase
MGPITGSQASDWARLAAEELKQALPALVVSRMATSLGVGKVLDWRQTGNRAAPFVSTSSTSN